MSKSSVWALFAGWAFAAIFAWSVRAGEPTASPVEDEVTISLHSPTGSRMLQECGEDSDYVRLSSYFVTQENLAYCGPASASIVLNALELPRPRSEAHGEYRLFDQSNFFTSEAERAAPRDEVRRTGMSLERFADAMQAHGVDALAVHASQSTPERFRDEARAALREKGRFVVSNYLRRALKQVSGGHISPLAAYHAESDRFLILDVSRYKYPPVWVRTDDLFRAMSADDPTSPVDRGYVILSRPAAD